MKIRNGFVSNSSSSSFIVIGNSKLYIPEINGDTLNVPEDFGGQTRFGWEIEDHFGFGSRVNFCYLQTMYIQNKSYLLTLEKVLKSVLKIKKINWNFGSDSYIDHQSNSSQGVNLQMFYTIHNLIRFLFDDDSHVHTDNDNY